MVINDIWGTIRIEKKYEGIINSKEFQELKNKSQLGLNSSPNATHTRYQHSIGVYFLACKLIEICKNKFSDVLTITEEDEEAIKCMALVHDIGHGAFSHVSEKFLEGTHEERSIEILLDPDSETHKAIINSFGDKVLDKVVDLIQMKKRIKENGEIKDDNTLTLIISKLLSGGIDIDRIDYIFRDSKFVLNQTNDFSAILENIDLECIDDNLEIVFDESAEYSIANFFNKRFELYDELYFDNNSRVIEEILDKLLKRTGKKITWSSTESEINSFIKECELSDDLIVKRYAEILISRKVDSNFTVKELNSKHDFDLFKERLLSNIPELKEYEEALFSSYCKVSTYNKDNKIFINKNGLIVDISECSKILNSSLTKEKYIFGIDLFLLNMLLKKDKYDDKKIKKILSKIKTLNSAEIEQEKKYVFDKDISTDPKEEFKLIRDSLELSNPEYIENNDIYYDYNGVLDAKRIAVRKRTDGSGKEEWNVKRPLNDKTSISKRNEITCYSKEEVLRFLRKEWRIRIKDLEEVVTLKTLRAKYNLEYKGGVFELVFDKTTPFVDEEEFDPNYMIECELKSGKSAGLYFINKIIKKFPFINESNMSKKEIALQNIKDLKRAEAKEKWEKVRLIILSMKQKYTITDLYEEFYRAGLKEVEHLVLLNLLEDFIDIGYVYRSAYTYQTKL